MGDSYCGSSCPTMEHCNSERQCNQSLSVVPFPLEDRPDREGVTPCDDLTPEDPSSLPPVQGAGGTNEVTGPMGGRNEIPEKPEELGEEEKDETMNGEVCSLFDYSKMKWAEWEEDEETMYDSDEETRCRGVWELLFVVKIAAAGLDKSKKVRGHNSLFTVPPILQPSSSVSYYMDQVTPEEHETCQDLPKCQRAENGDRKQCPGLEEDETIVVSTELPTCRGRTGPVGVPGGTAWSPCTCCEAEEDPSVWADEQWEKVLSQERGQGRGVGEMPGTLREREGRTERSTLQTSMCACVWL
ncbi:hypothetical protein H1C71_023002 [Ictidomys tridecemlineatus]|nr:hypothetical protein H1C71_023002 [Ictidomys tridecemlineatus]